MYEITDPLGHNIRLSTKAQKVVCLVPSLTETLIYLGVEVIGRTKFCIHPSKVVSSIPKIGGTKNPRIKDILKLNPDLIIANKEENNHKDIYELSNQVPVYVSDIKTPLEMITFIKDMNHLCEVHANAINLISTIEATFNKEYVPPPIKVLYLIWDDPPMAAGSDTFISAMLAAGGFMNIVNAVRYPIIRLDAYIKECEVLMLSSEPYPFKEKHIQAYKDIGFKNVICVDGEAFSWYGIRMIAGLGYTRACYDELQGRIGK